MIKALKKYSLLIAVLFTGALFSQSYNFRNYSVEHGLPFVQVSALYQDKQGYLWSGGYGGLSKFDGLRFVNFKPKDGLINHSVTSITQDKTGAMWIGTINGVSKLVDNAFTNFTTREGLSNNFITATLTRKNGEIWFASENGITVCNGQNFKNYFAKDGLSSNQVLCLFEQSNETLWMGTVSGVTSYTNGTFKKTTLADGLCDSIVTAIAEDGHENLWLGTPHGISVFSKSAIINLTTQNGLPVSTIKALCKDTKGNMWVATEHGLFKFDARNGITEKAIAKKYTIAKELNSAIVLSLLLDYEGNLWVGTYNGMYRYRGDAFIAYTDNDGLSSTFIYPSVRDRSGNFLVGTSGEGLFKMQGGRFSNVGAKQGFAAKTVNCFLQDEGNTLWIGTDIGLTKCNSDVLKSNGANAFTNWFKKDGLVGDSVNCMIKAHDGKYWLGGQNGITVFDGKKFNAIHLSGSLGNFGVFSMVEDDSHNIWMGTWLGGLFKYDGKELKEVSRQIGINSNSFFAIQKDARGVLYFGTLDGVFIYDGKLIDHIGEEDGLSSDLVYSMILTNHDSVLWVGTNQGINQFDVQAYRTNQQKSIKHFGKEEGFYGVECNSNGTFLDVDGSVWFGTVNGLVQFNPAEYMPNNEEPRTAIVGISIFDRDTLLNNNSVLPYNFNRFSFKFIGVSLSGPEKVRYQYMLKGFDADWSAPTKYHFADYSVLPPGNYTFLVRACNNEGVWNVNSASFSFTIARPYWKTWWFVLLVVVVVSSLVYAVIKYRINIIKQKEQEDAKRKVEIAGYELKALRSQMNPHFIFNSLNSIQSFILNNNDKYAAKYLNKFAKLIRMILNNSEKSNITIREELDMIQLYLELEELRFEGKFTYRIEPDPNMELDYFEIPSMLIQPYLENAILHGLVPKEGGGNLVLRISQTETHIVCTIEDNGIGRKRSRELQKNSARKIHDSMGMKITRDRLEMLNRVHNSNLGVTITDLESNTGEALGTRVEIFIPIT